LASCAVLSSNSCCGARSDTSENPRLGRFVNSFRTFGALRVSSHGAAGEYPPSASTVSLAPLLRT
jgi:hypothetical protein